MPSLDKITPSTDALEKWMKKYKGLFTVSDKLDGVSAMLYYEKKMLKLYTRGDGEKGFDISFLIPYVIPDAVDTKKFPDGLSVRGELIISKDDFDKLTLDRKNARNTVAGLVNSKTYTKRLEIAKITRFVVYAIINPEMNHYEQLKKAAELGFEIVDYKAIGYDTLSNDYLSKRLTKRREESDYDIDGLVVVHSKKSYSPSLDNPKYAFAFKQIMTDQYGESTVLDVIWTMSKDGHLKPTVLVEPITLRGVTITKVYAHNAKMLVDKVIGPGAVIKVIRSKDVIPYIMDDTKKAPNDKPKLPDVEYEWNKTGIDFVAKKAGDSD